MSSEYRTLSLKMSCGKRMRKKRLKNLYNHFCMCYHNIACQQCRKRDANDENNENFIPNNEYSEIMNNQKIHRFNSFLPTRSISEQQHSLMSVYKNSESPNVKINECKKVFSLNFSTFMMPLLIILFLHQVELNQAFNLDIGTRVVFSQPPSTMFGFSVAGHKEGNVGW